MKMFFLCSMVFMSFELSAQFSEKFTPNLLFKKSSEEFQYSGAYPLWNVYKEAQPDSTTYYELRGMDHDGNIMLRLKIDAAEYCDVCGEIICTKNNETFVLYEMVKN